MDASRLASSVFVLLALVPLHRMSPAHGSLADYGIGYDIPHPLGKDVVEENKGWHYSYYQTLYSSLFSFIYHVSGITQY
jgi:hypothetical protein